MYGEKMMEDKNDEMIKDRIKILKVNGFEIRNTVDMKQRDIQQLNEVYVKTLNEINKLSSKIKKDDTIKKIVDLKDKKVMIK